MRGKVAALWQWSQFLHKQSREQGKRPLLLNLDETSVPVVFTGTKGNIMVHNGARAWHLLPRQRTPKVETRTFFTHVAVICDDPTVQPILPQVIFVSAASITRAHWAALLATLPGNVYVKRMPKAWNNAVEHCVIIRILGLILQPFLATRQPILSFDAAGMHVKDEVLHELYLARVWYLLIPARLTWLLQPLDTHAFVKFKRWLKIRFHDALCAGPPAQATVRMLNLVIGAIRGVLQGHEWVNAFAHNGLAGDLLSVSAYIKQQLRYTELPPVEPTRPSADQLRVCWPRNREFHLVAAFKAIPPLVPVAAPAVPIAPVHAPASGSGGPAPVFLGPIAGLRRLNSKSIVP